MAERKKVAKKRTTKKPKPVKGRGLVKVMYQKLTDTSHIQPFSNFRVAAGLRVPVHPAHTQEESLESTMGLAYLECMRRSQETLNGSVVPLATDSVVLDGAQVFAGVSRLVPMGRTQYENVICEAEIADSMEPGETIGAAFTRVFRLCAAQVTSQIDRAKVYPELGKKGRPKKFSW